jgi:hypothetical protein
VSVLAFDAQGARTPVERARCSFRLGATLALSSKQQP